MLTSVKEKISVPEIYCTNLFGVRSEGYVKYFRETKEYVYVTADIEKPIISSPVLRKYAGQTLHIMYTGSEYGTGDTVIETEDCKVIYKFKK